jgi:hypothetical protein
MDPGAEAFIPKKRSLRIVGRKDCNGFVTVSNLDSQENKHQNGDEKDHENTARQRSVKRIVHGFGERKSLDVAKESHLARTTRRIGRWQEGSSVLATKRRLASFKKEFASPQFSKINVLTLIG